ncbi:MAG: tetratricopeptide repeat protein [Candidatus Omnitrophota bacterium]
MSVTLDVQIKTKTNDAFSVEVYERNSSQPLVGSMFQFDVSFLTAYEVSKLDIGNEHPEKRFQKLQAFGLNLYHKLFTPEIEKVWNDVKANPNHDFVTLCLRIERNAEKLELLPWETLYDGHEFIAAGVRTSLTRLPLDIPVKKNLPLLLFPLNMLAVISSPLDLTDDERLAIEKEQENLLRGVNAPAGQGRLRVDFEDEAQLPIIENALETPYAVFHYSGHGIDPKDGGGLLLEDMSGKKRWASVEDVLQTLEKGIRHFRLAMISGCQTARTLYASQFQDVARALARKGVPGVMAMQFSITDDGGLLLAEHLYPKLAEGVPVDKALSAVRRFMLQSDEPSIRSDALAVVLILAGEDILKAKEEEKPAVSPGLTIAFDKLVPLPTLGTGFYGRRKEYRMIRDGLLLKNERAVIVHGLGGIGKTALIEHVASRLEKHFAGICVFDCRTGALSPDVILLKIHRLLESKGEKVLEQLMHRNFPPDELAGYLGQVLCQVPLLIIFDNFETQLNAFGDAPFLKERCAKELLLEGDSVGCNSLERNLGTNGLGNTKIDGYAGPHVIRDQQLKLFLDVLVKTTAEKSRLLFTSRYVFDIDDKRVGSIRYMPLNELSRPEALGLMQHLPYLSLASYGDKMKAHRTFGGHPYSLVTLDRHCSMRSLSDVLNDVQGVHRELRGFLAIELNHERLTDKGKELLNRLAAFRQPVEWDAVHWVMGEKTPDAINKAMELVKKLDREKMSEKIRQLDDETLAQIFRNLLPEQRKAEGIEEVIRELVGWGMVTPVREEEEVYLTVHSLVREYCREKSGNEWGQCLTTAAGYYTNRHKLIKKDQKTLSMVLEEVEAAELLMEAGDFEFAAAIVIGIHLLLERWGWGRLLESLYERVLSGTELETRAKILHNQAMLMQNRGDYASALKQYEQSLKIKEELENRAGVAKSLHQIGMIYQDRGDYASALEQYEQSLRIEEELGHRAGVAKSLHQIGNIYYLKGEYASALVQYGQSLKIREEIGDKLGIAQSLHQIGVIYQGRGDYASALEQYVRAQQVFEDIGDRKSVTATLHNIGNIYYLKGDNASALEQYVLSLKIKEELDDKLGIAQSLHQIGSILHNQKKYSDAFEKYVAAFSVLEELQSPDAQIAFNNLIRLRNAWGEEPFDAAWQEQTGEPFPEEWKDLLNKNSEEG